MKISLNTDQLFVSYNKMISGLRGEDSRVYDDQHTCTAHLRISGAGIRVEKIKRCAPCLPEACQYTSVLII